MPAHRACETIWLLDHVTLQFIVPDHRTPNSCYLNLVDYVVWSMMQKHVYYSLMLDIDDMKKHLIAAWSRRQQHVIASSMR